MTARLSALAALLLALAPAPAQEPKKADAKAAPADRDGAADLAKRLAARVTLEKEFEGKFGEAVKMLAEQYDLPLVLDQVRKVEEGGDDPLLSVNQKVVLPRLADVRLETLLRRVCDQAGGKYLVDPDTIRVVPYLYWLYETGVLYYKPGADQPDPNDPNNVPLLPANELPVSQPLIRRAVVTRAFKGATVAEVLDEIATATGATVNLSPLVGNKSEAKLSVRFANTPVDAAVRTVCELADLGVIEDANTLTVTTRERVAEREKAAADREKAKAALHAASARAALNLQLQAGGGFGPQAAATDVGQEIGRLKEQNEALKRELEELKKALKK